jgi:dienelactone hydrolase
VFLFLFREGIGLSADQGPSAIDLMNSEFAAHGQDPRNALQLRLLENRELSASTAGLAYLRGLPGVNAHKLAIVAHSFGGSLTILQAAKEPDLRALIIFSGAGYSWDRSSELRTRLLAATEHIRAPVFFIHAANDYSLNPGKVLDARLAQRQATSVENLPTNRPHARRWPQFSAPGCEHLGSLSWMNACRMLTEAKMGSANRPVCVMQPR